MKINKRNILLQRFLFLSEAEMQGLLHPLEASFGYSLHGFSLQMPSTRSESRLALIPLAPKCHVSYIVCTQL
jgi:hypothetical protein